MDSVVLGKKARQGQRSFFRLVETWVRRISRSAKAYGIQNEHLSRTVSRILVPWAWLTLLLLSALPLLAQSPSPPTSPVMPFPGISLEDGNGEMGLPLQILLLLTLLTLVPAAIASAAAST